MIRTRFAPLALALFALAACDSSSDTTTKKAGSVAAVAAPAGTSWSEKVSSTPEGGVLMGNPEAPITLIEYGSYTCPHCKDFQAEAHEAIERDYVNTGKVKFEYRSFIRDAVDLTVTLIARCAPDEAFFAFNNQLFANQDAMYQQFSATSEAQRVAAGNAPPEQRFVKLAEMANLIEFAKQRGLPEDKVRACLADSKKAKEIAEQSDAIMKTYPQFAGTPSFILNGQLLDNTASWSKLQPQLRDAGA